ncbi:ATP-binding protein [Desulforhopalus singaporensis]|uniref:histidine kinase n=1 Tax=Desulforhopalus singaporensis TaxID=91360 RepID=A0A1H0M8R4_9BACT|nr:ATP-binding protein [Desulforhopalus singaporensis]SDO76510.1 Signal transduction histidine kinase [Desulforhopalus singaporensis]
MVELLSTKSTAIPAADLLSAGEVVAVVDDSPDIQLLLTHYLQSGGFNVVHAKTAGELKKLFESHDIALLILDIELPDKNGAEVLKETAPAYPDLGIIMVTGTADLEIALHCLREGADDYLTKPLAFKPFSHTVQNTLKKRRLAINYKTYQKELQITNARLRFLHQLNLKLNTAYLNLFELEKILWTILLVITAEDGLHFNRARLLSYDSSTGIFEGKMEVEAPLDQKVGHPPLNLDVILQTLSDEEPEDDGKKYGSIGQLDIEKLAADHILCHVIKTQRPVFVKNGRHPGSHIPKKFLEQLNLSSFFVLPLFSSSQFFGVIIVDNHGTEIPLKQSDIFDLEIFASQASLAIEHSFLYQKMSEKISALESVTLELEKSRDLLVASERDSTLGKISSKLLHRIRNPLTSIGGTARLLTRKTDDEYTLKFLEIITEETDKIEQTLNYLFTFAVDTKLTLTRCALFPLIRKTLMFFYTAFHEHDIETQVGLDEPGPVIVIDEYKIRQVVMHIVKNSIEAMHQGGTLTIQATEQPDHVSFFITDTGQGIAKEHLQLVTDPLFTTKATGNGMGLSLVDQIIKAHKGVFSIANSPGGGTVATVTLPILPAQQGNNHPEQRKSS